MSIALDRCALAQAKRLSSLLARASTTEILNVLDYGADPTGASNSTSAVNSAAAALPSPKALPISGGAGPSRSAYFGGGLLFPNGSYKLSSIPSGLSTNGNVGMLVNSGGILTDVGAMYPCYLALIDPASTAYPPEPCLLYFENRFLKTNRTQRWRRKMMMSPQFILNITILGVRE